MTVWDILGVWNLFMTRRLIPVYTAPCLKLPALTTCTTATLPDTKAGKLWYSLACTFIQIYKQDYILETIQ